MQTDADIAQLFIELWDDAKDEDSFPNKRPKLAHYTSISTLEKIVKTESVLFSNPLFMNDVEEIRFGMIEGARLFRESRGLVEACQSQERYSMNTI